MLARHFDIILYELPDRIKGHLISILPWHIRDLICSLHELSLELKMTLVFKKAGINLGSTSESPVE